MIISLVLAFVVLDQVLSDPDLCRNPKIDAITYVGDRGMWFFTSGPDYWYLKKQDFPPKAPTGKLPNGLSKIDAAVYRDWLTVCSKSKTTNKNEEKLVFLMAYNGNENIIYDFDIKTDKFWTESHSWIKDKTIGRIRMDNTFSPVEAMFSFRDTEIYIVQGNHYAGVDWKNMCDDPNAWAKEYDKSYDSKDLQSSKGYFDAIAVVSETMYQFNGHNFWEAPIDRKGSKNGRIVLTRSSAKNISQEFFGFKECPPPPTADTSDTPSTSGGESEGSKTPETPNQSPVNDEQNTNRASESPSKEGSGGNGLLYIVLGIVILVILVLIVGIFVALKTRKSSTQSESIVGTSATSATQSKVSTKSTGTPAKKLEKSKTKSVIEGVKPISSKK